MSCVFYFYDVEKLTFADRNLAIDTKATFPAILITKYFQV